MVDIVKVFPEVNDQYITFPPMAKIKPVQMLFKPPSGKGYSFALDARTVIMDQIRAQCRAQDTIR